MPKRATNPLSDARWPSTRAPSRSLTGILPPPFALSHIRPHARPSVRSSVRPSTRSRLSSLSRLSFAFSVVSLARPCFVSLSLSTRSDHEPAFARLLGRAPSSFAVFLAPPCPHPAGRCALCAMRCAPHCLCGFVRSALCARPCPARRGARGAARLGAPRRQVDDAMYVAQTVCNDGNRPTPLLSRIRISFHGQRRRPLRKRSR